MKIVSWNLNGLLSCVENNCFKEIAALKPDIVCLQEIRTQQTLTIINGYQHIFNPSQRDGYSGTAMLCKTKPKQVIKGFINSFPDDEGRVITAELQKCYVVGVYVPNSQANLKRHQFRLEWDQAFQEHIDELLIEKPVIICGDFNLVREDIDFFEENERQIFKQKGYLSDERSSFETLVEMGLTDAFRELYPNTRSYTWWSNRLNKRAENRGWRLDYFLVSDDLMPKIVDVKHLSDITGSDHCPIELEVRL